MISRFPDGRNYSIPDIVVSKGSVSNDNKGEEGSGVGDVVNEVFADDDFGKEGDIVIKQYHPGKVPG